MVSDKTIPLLETRQLTKQFGSLVANQAIDLAVYAGEVHAVLGENGAGKSTLMKSLYGFHQPTSGEIWLHGQPTSIPSPQAGRRLGIGMVFQNFTLVPAMTVLENIALFLPDAGMVIQPQLIEQRVTEIAVKYDLQVNVKLRVGELALGEQQKIEILKILLSGARILIFDEPTSVLAPHEVDGLFRIFRKLTVDGYAILFITHKLPEVMAVADRITVLRRGAVAGAMLRREASEHAVVALMVGVAPPKAVQRGQTAKRSQQPALELCNVSLHGRPEGGMLQKLDLQLFPGEIVGVAGVSGNGQRELGDAILGLAPLASGVRWIAGAEATNWSTRRILATGVACIPEEPMAMGAVAGMNVAENMVLGAQRAFSRYAGLTMDWLQIQHTAENLLNTTFVATAPRLGVKVEHLSGGNLQRVVIARELGRQPTVLLAYYPARGLDISNAEAMRRLLLQHRERGAAILLVSEDLDELFSLSDRLIVMYHGRIVGTFDPHTIDSHAVGHLMTGGQVSNLE